jgi:hypothetical protein
MVSIESSVCWFTAGQKIDGIAGATLAACIRAAGSG